MKKTLRFLLALGFIVPFTFCLIMAQEDDDLYYQSQQKEKSQTNQEFKQLKDYHVVLIADPLGFLTLGPSVHIEPALGKYIGLNAGIRFHNLGLLRYIIYGTSMEMSYIASGSLRIYPKPKNKIDGFFFGPGLGFGRSNYTSGSKYNVRNFGGELGYRWRLKNGIFLELSDNIGIVQSKNIEHEDDDWSTDMFVFYLLTVSIGIGL